MEPGEKFKAGDVVRLKSGGPKMTVVEYGKGYSHGTVDGYLCKWFDDKNVVKSDVFQEELLEPTQELAGASAVSGGYVRPKSPWS